MHGLPAYLHELTARLSAILDECLVGAWLVGSGALDDFDAHRSDIDVQAVCATRPRRSELERLAALLSHDALPCAPHGAWSSSSTRRAISPIRVVRRSC